MPATFTLRIREGQPLTTIVAPLRGASAGVGGRGWCAFTVADARRLREAGIDVTPDGEIVGLGGDGEALTEAELDESIEKSFRGMGLSESEARQAAAGRDGFLAPASSPAVSVTAGPGSSPSAAIAIKELTERHARRTSGPRTVALRGTATSSTPRGAVPLVESAEPISEADFDAEATEAFRRLGLSADQAREAARGRD